MSWFGKRKFSGSLEVGLCRGDQPGHLGVWARFPEGETQAVFQVKFNARSASGRVVLDPWSYTFLPAHERAFYQSVEAPLPFKNFLVGAQRVEAGEVHVEFRFSPDRSLTQIYPVESVLKWYRGKGIQAPDGVAPVTPYLETDRPYLGELPTSELEAMSERVKAEREAEKKRKEEEARLAKEAAEKKAAEEAAKKAAAAAAATGGAPKASGPTISGGKCALFFGSTTNNTADVAAALKEELGAGVDHVVNVASCSIQDFTVTEVLILGVPTWHIGEMQDDWAAILPQVKGLDFTGKKIAVFGLGDQKGYPETYVDAMGELVELFEAKGAKLFGLWPTDGYDFKKSKALRNGKFMGLVIDIENQNDKTPARVKAWADQLRKELGL